MDFILMSVWVVLKSLKKDCQAKKSVIVRCQAKQISDKEYEHALKVWDTFEMKTMKDYDDLYLKMRRFIVNWCVWKFRNSSLRNYLNAPQR